MGAYVGLDVSKEETAFYVKDGDGKVLARGKAPSDPAALFEALREHCLCLERIVLETGTMSGWLARALRALGLPVDVIDARQAHAVLKLQHNKTDAGDDMLFVGPFDLSAGLGHAGEPDHPEVRALIARVEAAAQAAGQRLGAIPTPGRSAAELVAAGYQLIIADADVLLLRDGARASLATLRAEK